MENKLVMTQRLFYLQGDEDGRSGGLGFEALRKSLTRSLNCVSAYLLHLDTYLSDYGLEQLTGRLHDRSGFGGKSTNQWVATGCIMTLPYCTPFFSMTKLHHRLPSRRFSIRITG